MCSVYFVSVGSRCLSALSVNEVYLHFWCCLKFLQDITILHSFCSLLVVMALLCVRITESLLCSQQSDIVSLFSMLISILCKNLAVITKIQPSLWPLLPIWTVISGKESKPLHGGKEIGKGLLECCWWLVPFQRITSS